MARKKASGTPRGSIESLPEEQQKDTTTFSIRLTEPERDRVTKAAQLKGWTPTNFVRTATLEKAAHVLNTSQVTNFNFKRLANTVAEHLCGPKSVLIPVDTGDW